MDTQIGDVETKIESLEKQLEKVENDISDVGTQIASAERKLEEAASDDKDDCRKKLARLQKTEEHLQKKEEQLRDEKLKLQKKEEQLRDEKLVLLKPDTSDSNFVDRSQEWIKHMLHPSLTGLPQNKNELAKVLCPDPPGKLPVLPQTYLGINSDVANKYLISADHSSLSKLITYHLEFLSGPHRAHSEMDISARLVCALSDLMIMWHSHSSCTFPYQLLFNCNERTGDSLSGSTKRRSRPETLLTASGCTFLVGEDKKSSLPAAKWDLEKKMKPLSAMFYGELKFILGYAAADSVFQWVYIGKNGKIENAGQSLDLSTLSGRCQFLLSIGYAYQLIRKMLDTVPEVPGRHAMFTKDVAGDREICFYPDSVRKSIKNFNMFCEERMTRLDDILEAYGAGERRGCKSLPRLRWGSEITRTKVVSRISTYTVEICPLGYSPTLRSEQDIRMLAKNVCEALLVLHEAGLVHRDVRYANVVQVSKEQFMLIDLETVAVSPFHVPEGFEYFSEWTYEMLEEGYYTPMSDMHQLGLLLENYALFTTVVSAPIRHFVSQLKQKVYSAATALHDPWLSDPIP